MQNFHKNEMDTNPDTTAQNDPDYKPNPAEEHHLVNMLFCFRVLLKLISIVSCQIQDEHLFH